MHDKRLTVIKQGEIPRGNFYIYKSGSFPTWENA